MSDFTASNGYTVFHREHDSTTDLVLQVYAPNRTETMAESLTREQVIAIVEYAGSIGIHAPMNAVQSDEWDQFCQWRGTRPSLGEGMIARAGWNRVDAALHVIDLYQREKAAGISLVPSEILGDVAVILRGESVFPMPEGVEEQAPADEVTVNTTLDELQRAAGLTDGRWSVERITEVLAAYIHGDNGKMPAAEAYFTAVIEDRCDQTHIRVDGEEFAEFQAWRQGKAELARLRRQEESMKRIDRAANGASHDEFLNALREFAGLVQAGDIDLGPES